MRMTTIETPLGPMTARFEGKALTRLFFGTGGEMGEVAELSAYFAGELTAFTLPIVLRGTPFQRRVWEALLTIPYGETWSYKELAAAVGNPKACRAVAQANRVNPVAIIVPCHRVIQSDGALGGYAGCAARKRRLLDHEMLWKDRAVCSVSR